MRKTVFSGTGLKGGPSKSGGRLLTIRRATAGLDKWQRLFDPGKRTRAVPPGKVQNPAYTPCFFKAKLTYIKQIRLFSLNSCLNYAVIHCTRILRGIFSVQVGVDFYGNSLYLKDRRPIFLGDEYNSPIYFVIKTRFGDEINPSLGHT